MTNINTIIKNGGATLDRNGRMVTLKSGYQLSKCDLLVIDKAGFCDGILRLSMERANLRRGEYLRIWIDDGKVYIDKSRRAGTKREALVQGRAYNQQSVYDWKNDRLVWC